MQVSKILPTTAAISTKSKRTSMVVLVYPVEYLVVVLVISGQVYVQSVGSHVGGSHGHRRRQPHQAQGVDVRLTDDVRHKPGFQQAPAQPHGSHAQYVKASLAVLELVGRFAGHHRHRSRQMRPGFLEELRGQFVALPGAERQLLAQAGDERFIEFGVKVLEQVFFVLHIEVLFNYLPHSRYGVRSRVERIQVVEAVLYGLM